MLAANNTACKDAAGQAHCQEWAFENGRRLKSDLPIFGNQSDSKSDLPILFSKLAICFVSHIISSGLAGQRVTSIIPQAMSSGVGSLMFQSW
jgi:hypothetical protein